ncbi:MAG: DUF4418 family protein [Treponema sp.]|nr:DUF4418 family protein [Treponema sp.]
MKRTIIFCALVAVSGLLIAFGPYFIFKACSAGCCSEYPTCYWMTGTLRGIGIIIAGLGIFSVLYNDPKTQLGISIAICLTGIIALLVTHVIIGGCALKNMNCRLVAIPALTVIEIFVIIYSGLNIFIFRKK